MKIRDRIPGLKTALGGTQSRRRARKRPGVHPASRVAHPRKNLKQRARRKPDYQSGPRKWFGFLRRLFK